jgi:hypothetical protein
MLIFRIVSTAILALGICQLVAAAQSPEVQTPYSIRNKIYLGGTYLRGASGPGLNSTNSAGWNVMATHYITPLLGLSADVQGNYGHAPVPPSAQLSSDPFVYQNLFFVGPQLRWRRKAKFASSVRLLAGVVDTVSDTDTGRIPPSAFGLYPNATKLALKPGAAFDFNLSPRIALRYAGGLLLEREDGGFQKYFNASVGVVFRVGTVK